ncbi:MAG: C40 family peptidase [Bacteroidales bacterium]|nr:C40 family peptidase [Bacteroidales bacterium]
MKFGICNLSSAPLRIEPSHKSEMVNELLFGETYKIIEKYENWYKIISDFDDYHGWINENQFCNIDEMEYTRIKKSKLFYTKNLCENIFNKTKNIKSPIIIGSTLPALKNKSFKINNDFYEFYGDTSDEKSDIRESLIKTAKKYLNAPYLWGGRSPFGIDCSGFTQIVFKIQGIELFRDAAQQATQGKNLNFISEAKPGDLAFFDNEEGDIVHVGIIMENKKIIHAYGCVRIDNIDHNGIFNSELNKYTHNLRLIKKII